MREKRGIYYSDTVPWCRHTGGDTLALYRPDTYVIHISQLVTPTFIIHPRNLQDLPSSHLAQCRVSLPVHSVHLLAFADEVESCECDDGLELPADLLRAETWLRSLQLGRGTNTAAALETALALPDIGTVRVLIPA